MFLQFVFIMMRQVCMFDPLMPGENETPYELTDHSFSTLANFSKKGNISYTMVKGVTRKLAAGMTCAYRV